MTSPWARLARHFPDGVLAADCPSRVVLNHVTSRWGVLVLVSLAGGPQRWAVLHRRIEGVSDKMLAQTLRTLADDGFVQRTVLPDTPPGVEYRLTDRGHELAVHLVPLMEWIVDHAVEIVAS